MPVISKRFCPKCLNKTYGHVFLSGNLYIGKSEVICFWAYCNFNINNNEWNKLYPTVKFKDKGYLKEDEG